VAPTPVAIHPDGNVYFGGQTNHVIYSLPADFDGVVAAQTVFPANTAVINNPAAIAVLPNGNLIVASDATDSIAQITRAGDVVNANFIKDAFTSTITAILVIPPQ
jgi:streptogramin lyase